MVMLPPLSQRTIPNLIEEKKRLQKTYDECSPKPGELMSDESWDALELIQDAMDEIDGEVERRTR